ncbi:MAG: hypothetical protein KOO63_14155 [Bacteroidales bacterium]|nr:hypothetical protein [Candidatus Latescibacterota bacterium]
MSRKYVFLVHGIGRHQEGEWSKPWKAAILNALKKYSPFNSMTDGDLDQQLAFVPISYDSVFEGFRSKWGGLAEALGNNDIIANPGLRKAFEWVADNETEDNGLTAFFWDNVLDAILWYAFPQARGAAIAKVVEQLAAGARKMYDENNGVNTSHVLAHSLGTSVSHDALVSLRYAGHIHGGAFDSKHHKWRSVFMISNTSRLFRTYTRISDDVPIEEYAPYTSNMKSGTRPSAICMRYANVYHRVDPVSWPRRFAPADWPFSSYLDIETIRFDQQKEIHNIDHYMANPHVHIPFLRSVLQRDTFGTAAEVAQSMNEFERDYPNQAANEFAQLRDLLNGDFDRKLNTRELAEFLVKTYKELQ